MVQEHSEKPKPVNQKKYVRLILWIVITLILGFVANNLWTRYREHNPFVTKQIEHIENTGSDSASASASVVKSLDDKAVAELQLRDAYFMTRIAATILQNHHDIAAALELLNTAQEHLNSLQGEKVDQAKALLTADISKLSSIQASDNRGVQDKLVLLDSLAAILPLKHEIIDVSKYNTAKKDVTANAAGQSRWHQSIQNILTEAKTIVKVKKRSGEAQLSEVTVEIKHAQFRLLMEQIRWALFYKDSDVYKISIVKLQQLVPEIFDTNSDIVKQFYSTLTEMSMMQINVDVPNIQESVNALKALLVG